MRGNGWRIIAGAGVAVILAAQTAAADDFQTCENGSGDYGTTGCSGNGGSHGQLTYEQAWAACKKFVDVLPRDAQSQRYSRGAACMHQYGYKL